MTFITTPGASFRKPLLGGNPEKILHQIRELLGGIRKYTFSLK